MASCQQTTIDETTVSSESESESEYVEEDDGISVGDHIVFGSYPQKSVSGTDTFDPEPIEWRVLDIQDGKALIISEYAIQLITASPMAVTAPPNHTIPSMIAVTATPLIMRVSMFDALGSLIPYRNACLWPHRPRWLSPVLLL